MRKKLRNILLVDDDDATNFINRKVLESAGVAHHIEVALNGREAINFFKTKSDVSEEPVLVFLDINMPIMDGWEFLEVYRSLSINKKGNVIIVMLSTTLNPDDITKAENISEVSGFRNKPLTLEMVQEIMEKYFPEYL